MPSVEDSGRIRITRADVSPCAPDWVWVNTGALASEVNIWLVSRGRGWLQRRGEASELRPGDCFVLRHRVPHRAWHDPAAPLLVPWVCFEFVDANGRAIAPVPEERLPPFHRRVDGVGFLGELIGRCAEAFNAGRHADAVGWLEAVLLEVNRQDARPLDTSLQRRQARRIEALCQQAERDIGAFRRVEDLARPFGCGTDHFIRLFKRLRHVTPGEFLIRTRIRRACDLLRFSGRNVTDIADALGYGDVYAFSKQFRSRMGRSPTAYRRGA